MDAQQQVSSWADYNNIAVPQSMQQQLYGTNK